MKAIDGLRPSFSAHVRFGERGAPVDSLQRGYDAGSLLASGCERQLPSAAKAAILLLDNGRPEGRPLQCFGVVYKRSALNVRFGTAAKKPGLKPIR
jgi:hypothetical protein